MNIINLTPHSLTICDEDKTLMATIPASGIVARIKVEKKRVGWTFFEGRRPVRLFETAVSGEPHCYSLSNPSEILPLPETQDDTILIVSGMFRQYFDRPDLYQPGELIRDAAGQPIGCIGLSR